ncbi:MAG: thiopurine S-methyltransferase [Flavobacterium sp. BFFFF1]|uniref:methyltransferase domain-containing protein n=1 Tax=Flavobacterium sp. BFFFF1 TaxID=2015557 RepID=UPI000BC8046E|nr:methyltransferase domain-containing protein [Flavobacterium sp. BFFFF1]OYU79655.1 MAG: thiopurine S-methyltransferase [Flavobacterium sp. BFFFF1]
MEEEEKCCVVSCDKPIDENYWNQQYAANTVGWDLGVASPAIKNYINSLPSKDLSILIPGCGNAYEAEYLLEKGFTNITIIDIAPLLVAKLQNKFASEKAITIILGDFFDHKSKYDLIIEQTFFCALPPQLRQRYVFQMHRLLKTEGTLAGLLFNRNFEDGPPFGGSKPEYEDLFTDTFMITQMGICPNSVEKRAGMELFFEMKKNDKSTVALYRISGVTCKGCSKTITEKMRSIDGVLNCSISLDFTQMLLVSVAPVAIDVLKDTISYDKKYQIEPIETSEYE